MFEDQYDQSPDYTDLSSMRDGRPSPFDNIEPILDIAGPISLLAILLGRIVGVPFIAWLGTLVFLGCVGVSVYLRILVPNNPIAMARTVLFTLFVTLFGFVGVGSPGALKIPFLLVCVGLAAIGAWDIWQAQMPSSGAPPYVDSSVEF